MRPLDRLSLEDLRVFEAAARWRNFSAAARERGVTQAAVSRRVQGLERDLGVALFLRRGRRLSLTAEGERLGRRVRAALDYLGEGLAELAPETASVSLAASGSVSHFWLGPALRAFAAEHPDVTLRLTTTDDMAALADEAHDVTILYGAGEHPRWALTPLLPERLAPVATPALIAACGGRIEAMAVLDYAPLNAHWRTLRDWATWAGLPAAPRARLRFSTYATTVEAALRGDGAALGSLALLRGHLAAGALAQVCGPVWETGMGYHVGLPRDRAPSPAAEALRAALLAEAASPGGVSAGRFIAGGQTARGR